MSLRRLGHELLGLLVPPACVACRSPLAGGDELLCAACRRAMPWLPAPLCPRCALPVPCRPCPAAGSWWQAAWAPVAYDGSARDLVCALKFTGRLAAADAMGAMIAANAPAEMLRRGGLVPVPLHPARRRKRGFNQSEHLARALAGRTGLPVRRCLARRGRLARQVGARRLERLAPGRLAIDVCRAPPEVATLVDDVHTTGATLDACARALREGGARRVACLTFARTLR